MAEKEKNTLSKEERIYSLSLIDDLFKGGKSRSMTVFPLRAIYKSWDDDATDAGFQAATLCPKMLISVPKKHFHHAVDRNRVKRRSEEHTSELQSRQYLVCRLLLEKKKKKLNNNSLYIYKKYNIHLHTLSS